MSQQLLDQNIKLQWIVSLEPSQHIWAIYNAFQNNFKTMYNALMPDMNTSHKFTVPNTHKYK